MSKVLIWLASGDREKLLPGIVWGTNAHKFGWVDEVRFVAFGEAERTFDQDEALFGMIHAVNEPMYCKYMANEQGITEALEDKGAKVAYVGEPIAEMIRQGYRVLVF